MENIIINWLNRPLPFFENKKQGIVISILFGFFIFIFLAIFQPFGFSAVKEHKLLFIAGFGFITFFVVILINVVLPILFTNYFKPDNWTMKKNIIFSTIIFLLISILNWLYNSTVGLNIAPQHSLWSFIFYTLVVGMIPSFILSDMMERRIWKKKYSSYKNQASEYDDKPQKDDNDLSIQIQTDNKGETLDIHPNSLVCIGSIGNYSEFFLYDGSDIKKKTLRISLKKAEEYLEDYNYFVRCHRSYIINVKKVQKVSGNIRNCALHIEDLDFSIPVSRNLQKTILEKVNKTIEIDPIYPK